MNEGMTPRLSRVGKGTEAELLRTVDGRQLKLAFGRLSRKSSARGCVAASLVSFHVASDAKRLATAGLRTLVGLLACVTVTVDAEATWPREGLVTGRADVSILRLWEL